MRETTTDQMVMNEAADTLASLRKRCAELEERALVAENLSDSLIASSGEKNDEQESIIAKQEAEIENLKATVSRLAGLIHPDYGDCVEFAGVCSECNRAVNRHAGRVADVKALCAAAERVLTDGPTVTVMPIEIDGLLMEALAEVRKWVGEE